MLVNRSVCSSSLALSPFRPCHSCRLSSNRSSRSRAVASDPLVHSSLTWMLPVPHCPLKSATAAERSVALVTGSVKRRALLVLSEGCLLLVHAAVIVAHQVQPLQRLIAEQTGCVSRRDAASR